MFGFGSDKRTKFYISLTPKDKGGGSNTFACNFINWIKKHQDKYKYVKNILKADRAIIIADKADVNEVKKAKSNKCFIIHRLDEYFEENESEYRRKKHQKIIELNKFADITVYQSKFVFQNVHPYLQPSRYEIIINGADPNFFYPSSQKGIYIGHVSWSYDERKRFDLLYDLIQSFPQEKFLLVGNHRKTKYPFDRLDNVVLVGSVNRKKMRKYYQMMKVLYLPSEKDPCPNVAVEAILCGVPVCYNPDAGTKEIVRDCGLPLTDFEQMLNNLDYFRNKCLLRNDLYFGNVAEKYSLLS